MDRNREIDYYLRLSGLGKNLSDKVMEQLKIYKFKAGEHIVRSGEPLDRFYFFVEGRGKVYTLLENGKSLLIRFYSPLEIIGEIEMFTGTSSLCYVQAVCDVVCLGLKSVKMLEACRSDPPMMEFLCKSLSHKLLNFNMSSSINQFYPVENRLASYLLSVSAENIWLQTDKMSEMADLLGTSYRHLSRTIRNFCESGIIEKKGKIIEILDEDKLKELAGEIYT